MKVKIYDPPMCCPTGLCGGNIDPELLRIQDVIIGLKNHGVEVERYNLAKQLPKFMLNPVIATLLKTEGRAVLPITVVGDQVIKKGAYPSQEELNEALEIEN